jgi:hypothetical protein
MTGLQDESGRQVTPTASLTSGEGEKRTLGPRKSFRILPFRRYPFQAPGLKTH